MGKPYSEELDGFERTFDWAAHQDVDRLTRFLLRWSGNHAVVVGSGGSYSAAAVVALFRELAHRSPTSAVTPLDFVSIAGRMAPRALLLSAEGKNKDVLMAAQAAIDADLATGAVTLTADNPLVNLGKDSQAARVFAFPMAWVKDGYLATNSLLATVLLLYRAFFGHANFERAVAPLFAPQRLANRRAAIAAFTQAADLRRRNLLLLHSPSTKAFALDVESKLAEASLAFVQVTDLRQFAHGRHLQLASRTTPQPFVVTTFARADRALADATIALLPESVPQWSLEIEGEDLQDLAVAGLIDAMFFTEAVARGAPEDIGSPFVPQFGRALHALDAATLVASSVRRRRPIELALIRKAAGSTEQSNGLVRILHAAEAYAARLAEANIKAIVCDFDGTLCRTEDRFDDMPEELVEVISRLLHQGMKFAVATGRGDSLHQSLRRSFDRGFWQKILVGYYSGSVIATLDTEFALPAPNSEFHELHEWLERSIYGHLSRPFGDVARGGQLGIRVSSVHDATRLHKAIRIWLDKSGRAEWRVFSSGHSVDVLDQLTTKRLVVRELAKLHSLDELSEVLKIGDCGHEDGNDFELLDHGLSLSCDRVSADLDSCWNFSPSGSNQAESTIGYLRALTMTENAFRMADLREQHTTLIGPGS